MALLKVVFVVLSILSVTQAVIDVPTVVPADPFNPVEDAQRLRDALNSVFFVDEAAVVDVLCHRTSLQRENITATYNSVFGRNLRGDMDNKLNGDFNTLSIMLTYRMAEFLAIEAHQTMFGPLLAGPDEVGLIEILLSSSNAEMADINLYYLRQYGHPITDDIRDKFSFGLEEMLVTMSQGIRDESTVIDSQLVVKDASDLYFAAQARPGADEPEFARIFSQRSFAHMLALEEVYLANYLFTLRSVVETEFNGGFRDALLDVLDYTEDKAKYFAVNLEYTTSGLGTNERSLSRQVVHRCEYDLGNIKESYEKTFGRTLRDDVDADTSGAYQNGLLTLIG